LFFVLVCVGAFAQANSDVTGIVTDQTGAVVAGANVVLTETATGAAHTTVASGTGLYDIAGLNPGAYNLKVTAKGFETYAQTGIVVNVSGTFRVDVKLTVGSQEQTVTVVADALTVQTDSNVVSTLISSEEITSIATENRNFAALASLGLGVSSALPDSNTPMAAAGGSSFTISANGLRQSHNIWLIDGGESDDRGGAGGMALMPAQDSIAEFTMMTSNYPPDYGISSGATFSLSLKSGTQQFHGTAYEFNRNTDYDANDYFNHFNGANNARAVLNYNIYGFNVGGPLYIPKTYNTNKQKTFFFWNEEWRNIKQAAGTNVQNTLPAGNYPTGLSSTGYVSPAFGNHDLSMKAGPVEGIIVPLATTVSDPAFKTRLATNCPTCVQGSPFPGNSATNPSQGGKIPAAMMDQNMVKYLAIGVLPPVGNSNDQSVEVVPAPLKIRDDVVRVDHKFNDKWQLLVHYMHDNQTDNNAHTFLGWDWSSYNSITSSEISPSYSAAVKLSGMITPNLLVEGSLNYDGNIIDIDNNAKSNTPAGWTAGSFFANGRTTEIPNMSGFGSPYGTGEQMGSAPWHNAAQDIEPKLDLSYTMGKHAMKYGFSYNRYTKNQQLFGSANGSYSLGGDSGGKQYSGNGSLAACQPPSAGWSATNPAPANCVIGDGIVDALLGLAGSYSQQNAQPIDHYVNFTPSIYAMDNWHVTPRLTLQLGLRWDALPQAYERNNLVSNFNPDHYQPSQAVSWVAGGSMLSTGPGFETVTVGGVTTPAYLNGMDLAGSGGTPRQLVTNVYNTVQPRIGFSEDLFGNGKTVIRGGVGTFYERLQGNLIYNSATDSPFAFSPNANQVYFDNPHTSLIDGSTVSTPFFDSGEYNMAESFPDPAVAMFSLGVQHELAPSIVAVVQYVGNIAWHQEQYANMNNFPLTTPLGVRYKNGGGITTDQGVSTADGKTPVGNLLLTAGQGHIANISDSWRTYQGYGGITSMINNTNGSYNGFQTGVRIQNRWGLSGEVDYTWSHEMDIQSYDNSCCTSNPWNLRYDKGAGALDRRHILSANYIYKMPFFNKSQGLVKTIAGGWQLAGTVTAETGTPVTLSGTGGDTVGLGGGYNNRPNVSGKMSYPKNIKGWFYTTKVSYPAALWNGGQNLGFGNAHKDAMVGPGRLNFTTSLYKAFAITERAHFELRFESFNTFNHAQFNGVNSGYGGSPTANNFGWLNSDWGPRTLELGGKFVF